MNHGLPPQSKRTLASPHWACPLGLPSGWRDSALLQGSSAKAWNHRDKPGGVFSFVPSIPLKGDPERRRKLLRRTREPLVDFGQFVERATSDLDGIELR